MKKSILPEFLSRGGEMGERIRSFDWSTTSLGVVQKWPQSLRSALSICLNSNFPIAIYWGKDLVLLYNDAWSPIPGNKHPWALGRTAKEVWPEIWNDIEPQFKKAFDGDPGGSKDALLPMLRHGYVEECYFDFTFTPVYGEGGKVEGIFNAVIETTKTILNERRQQTLRDLSNLEKVSKNLDDVYKAAAKALEGNNKDFPFVLIYKINEEGTEASQIAYAGIEPGQKMFPSIIDITQPAEGTFDFCKAFVSNELYVSENNGRRKNIPKGGWDKEATHFIHLPITNQGRKHPYAILSAALNPYRKFDEAYQQFAQLVGDQISTEVNNVLVIEEERKRAEALAEIDKAKTVFFSNISHEFRTPLTLILGSLEELINGQQEDSEATNKEMLETTHRNAMRLLRLVNKLLDFSRIEAGRVKAEFQITNIAQYTADLAANFRSVIENAGLNFSVTTGAIVHPVYIDKEMWEKIVFNLLSNAFKYTLSGSIHLSLTTAGSHVQLKVKDSGVGIPGAELPKMFQRFHRVQNVVGRTYEGTGIGLSLVNELVKLHGGKISVTSQEGKGTEFTISIPTGKKHLPLSDVIDDEDGFSPVLAGVFIEEAGSLLQQPVSENRKENPGTLKETTSILVVDDNADMRSHIKNLLQKEYSVITANNGMEALQQIKKYSPHLVVSDIMMPVMDGIQLLKTLKDDPHLQNIPVILLSARAGEEAKIEGYKTGADDYLIKPFSAKELLARVGANIKLVKSRKLAEDNLRNIIMQSPVAMAVFRGASHIIEVANKKALTLWNRSPKNTINLPAAAAMPELVDLGFIQILDDVYRNGKTFIANEFPVITTRDGKKETLYLNFIFQPLKNNDAKVEGIVGIGTDVTEQVISRKKLEESETRYHNLIYSSPSAIALLKGKEFIITVANDSIIESWGKGIEVIGKPLLSVMPEVARQGFEDLLTHVYTTGVPYYGYETPVQLLRHGKWETVFYNFVCQAIRDPNGEVEGLAIIANEVTPQALFHKKIEENEEQLRIALEAGELGTYDFFPQTGELIWSDRTKEFFGLPVDAEINFDTLMKGLHPDDKERSQKAINEAMDPARGFYENEYRTIDQTDGKIRWIRSKGKVVFDANGTPVRFIGVVQDISGQKEMLRSLQLQSLVLERMDEGVSVSDEHGIIHFTNSAENKMFGYQEGELIGKHVTIQNAYPQEENERIVAGVIKELKRQGFWSGEWHNKKKDGTPFYTFSFITQLEVDGGNLFVCVQRDITEDKKARERLGYASTLIQNVIDAVIGTDVEHRITSWNKGAEDLYGYKEQDILGKLAAEIIPTEFPGEEERRVWEQALNTKGQWQGEVRQKKKDGLYVDVLASIAYVKNEAGEVLGAVTVNKDITARKLIEQDLKNTKDQLELTFKNIPAGVYLIDKAGQLIYVNDRGARVYGNFTPEELLAEKDLVSLLKKADALFERYDEKGGYFSAQHSPAFISLTTAQPSQVILKQINKETKEVRWHYVQGAPLFDNDGKVFMVLVTSTDITSQKNAEENIRESEEKFRTLAETLPAIDLDYG